MEQDTHTGICNMWIIIISSEVLGPNMTHFILLSYVRHCARKHINKGTNLTFTLFFNTSCEHIINCMHFNERPFVSLPIDCKLFHVFKSVPCSDIIMIKKNAVNFLAQCNNLKIKIKSKSIMIFSFLLRRDSSMRTFVITFNYIRVQLLLFLCHWCMHFIACVLVFLFIPFHSIDRTIDDKSAAIKCPQKRDERYALRCFVHTTGKQCEMWMT